MEVAKDERQRGAPQVRVASHTGRSDIPRLPAGRSSGCCTATPSTAQGAVGACAERWGPVGRLGGSVGTLLHPTSTKRSTPRSMGTLLHPNQHQTLHPLHPPAGPQSGTRAAWRRWAAAAAWAAPQCPPCCCGSSWGWQVCRRVGPARRLGSTWGSATTSYMSLHQLRAVAAPASRGRRASSSNSLAGYCASPQPSMERTPPAPHLCASA